MGDGTAWRRVLPNGLLAVISVIIFFGGAELLLRALSIASPTGGGGHLVATYLNNGGKLQPFQEEDAERLWRYREDQAVDIPSKHNGVKGSWRLTTDGEGFRATPPSSGPEVLFMGDSVTMGFGVNDAEAFPAVVAGMLGRSVRVVNAGVSGYSSEQGRVYLADLLPRLKPAVVVIEFGIDDDWPSLFRDQDLVSAHPAIEQMHGLLRRSRLYRVLRGPLVQAKRWHRQRQRHPGPRVDPARYHENLLAMSKMAARQGAAALFVAPPSKREHFQVSRSLALHAPISLYRGIMAATASESGADYVDPPILCGRSRSSRYCFLDFCHPNEYGHCLLASALAPRIAGLLG